MKKSAGVLTILSVFVALAFTARQKPTLYLIGDSTVHNNDQVQWGWGSVLPDLFNLHKIDVQNHAMAGRSTRTFIKEGRWQKSRFVVKAWRLHNDAVRA